MKNSNVLKSLATLVAFLLLVTPVMAAPPQGPEPIVQVENHGIALLFYPLTSYRELVLTVTGPCGYEYRQRVNEGELFFELDETTIDGAYTFNVVRHEKISSGVVNALRTARKNFDEETPKKLCREGLMPPAPALQSSGFLVANGKIVYDPEAVDEATSGDITKRFDDPYYMDNRVDQAAGSGVATKDFQINDDLIVDGSACIGFDCVNGESFGFDTIRLKENNLRIKFEDTSSAASFPTTDWQLTANDSANGGASKFSIDDISGGRTPFTVEANARSHSLYVDDGGRIGNRTSTPSTEIHSIDGDTPTLRLQQDGSSGFAPQTWDLAGNETNFFIRDVSNGSTLPFRIRPGAPTSAIYVDVDGDISLNQAGADAASSLHIVANTGAADDVVLMENNGATRFALMNTMHGDTWRFNYANTGEFRIGDSDATVEFQINGAGDVVTSGTVNGVSDRNKKKDFVTLDPTAVLDAVAGLPISEWSYKHDPKELRHVGPMAQDFWAAFGLGMDDRHIALTDMSGVALAAIQGLNAEVEEKDVEIETLRDANDDLEARVARLEAMIEGLANR